MGDRLSAPSGEPGRPGRDPWEKVPGAGAPGGGGGSNATADLSDSPPNGRGAPVRVQLSRKKGARMPPNTVAVTRPSKYSNPFRVPPGLMPAARLVATLEAVAKYKRHVALSFTVDEIRRDLGGKNLACYCPLPKPGEPDLCHAAVLLAITSGGTGT